MANLKVTLDYFPHIQLTRNMEMIGAEFKEKGYSIMWSIFEEIFMRGEGYYCDWNDDVALMFIQLPWLSVGVNVVSEIINAMFRRDILSKEMYEKYGILTSEYIQEVYFTAVSRRKKISAKKEYLLVNADKISDNVNIIAQNVNIISENVDILKQRKEKEIKGNKKKEGSPSLDYQMIIDNFNRQCSRLSRVEKITDTRRQAIKRAVNKGVDLFALFDKVKSSDFLNGKNDRGWTASFDWILKPSNLQKIMEGNYNNRQPDKPQIYSNQNASYDLETYASKSMFDD